MNLCQIHTVGQSTDNNRRGNIDTHMLIFPDGINDQNFVDDFLRTWRIILAQKAVLVCLKVGSDEIAGINMNFVWSKGDTFIDDFEKHVCYYRLEKNFVHYHNKHFLLISRVL